MPFYALINSILHERCRLLIFIVWHAEKFQAVLVFHASKTFNGVLIAVNFSQCGL